MGALAELVSTDEFTTRFVAAVATYGRMKMLKTASKLAHIVLENNVDILTPNY